MPLGTTTIDLRLSAIMTRLINDSQLESRTELGADGVFRFTDGTGAAQAAAVIDVDINNNNTPVAFSTFMRTDGNAFSAETKIKAAIFYNPSANAAATVATSVTGVAVGKLDPGGLIAWISPSAGGLAITGASTFTINGTTGQFTRVLLLVA
jgi:hypothetical protein